ncbi:hypothetical protein ACWDTJ_29600, partial [Nocardia farcinica]
MLDAATGRPALITDARTAAYARLHETHTGVVVLCGDRAYKVKKPVVTDFLDFGTVELRERACRRSNDQNLWIPGGRAFPEDDRRSHRILIKTSV